MRACVRVCVIEVPWKIYKGRESLSSRVADHGLKGERLSSNKHMRI